VPPAPTIDFDKNFDKTLTDLVDSTDATTKADVIRRAAASYKFPEKAATHDQGRQNRHHR
jgi:hypothetical protein